jgi:tetratricopeptide (TPR) repeat protein/tRNA A-37 threonylcarbamoyl transferase component Bud32
MLCPFCGAETDAPEGICSSCGLSVAPTQEEASASTILPLPPTAPEDATKASPLIGQSGSKRSSTSGGTRARGTRGIAGAGSLLQPGDAFGSRYRILRTLGAGGMGVVYQSWDDELGVAVALKVIKPEVMADPEAAQELERRFKRELLLARQVTHKNVVRIHDIGDVDGVKYLTMPYIEGDDLASMLRESGPLPVPRALRIGRQVAAGLQAAHEAGVVHRDLKPENIMVEAEDHAMIMDFGISRSISGTGAGTTFGSVIGTLEYMAPEQGRGQPVDHRADIYSFGLLLYDMLAGRRRLDAAENPAAEMMSRMHQPPPALRSIAPSVPEPLERIVSKCLHPDASQRYSTTAELVADLNRLDASGHLPPEVVIPGRPQQRRMMLTAAIVATVVTVALTVGIGYAFRWFGWLTPAAGVPAERDTVSVVIADFDNKTNDPLFDGVLEQALGLGIEDAAFIVAYPRTDAVRVIQQIAPGQRLDAERAQLIAQREGIKIVLASSIVPSGSGYAITVRAIDPFKGTELDKVEVAASSKQDVLQAMGKVASGVRELLGDTTPEGVKIAAAETFTASSLEAAKEYTTAQSLANSNKDEEAIKRYQRALSLDPNFGRAYSGWAMSAVKLGRTEESEEMLKKALEHLDRMTEREKYRTLGNYYRQVGNHENALDNYRTLVDKYPADGAAHNGLALAYFNTLEFAKAREAGGRVVKIYPGSVLYRYNHALYAMYAGDFDTAESEAREALKINPQTPKAYVALAIARMMKGDEAGARDVYAKAADAAKGGNSTAARRIASFARLGLADLSMYRGDYAVAPILDAGIADDRARKDVAGEASKLIALAEARLASGDRQGAVEAAKRAAATSDNQEPTVAAARILIAAGRHADARPLIDRLAKHLESRPRAYAKLLEGESALARGQKTEAIDALRAAQKLANLWLVRFNLGRAYLEAERFPDALAEFEECERRRGEATAVFLDDMPSVRHLAPLPYWLARASEGLGSKDSAVKHYRAYLSLRQPASDPLAADAERRLKSLQ